MTEDGQRLAADRLIELMQAKEVGKASEPWLPDPAFLLAAVVTCGVCPLPPNMPGQTCPDPLSMITLLALWRVSFFVWARA